MGLGHPIARRLTSRLQIDWDVEVQVKNINSARTRAGCWLNYVLRIVNTLRRRQNGRRYADDTFKHIFLNENVRISIKISPKFVPKGPINNNSALVHILALRRSGDKPLSEPMMVSLMTHICVTRPQWVKNDDNTDEHSQHRCSFNSLLVWNQA